MSFFSIYDYEPTFVTLGNEFFAEIKFREFCESRLISRKLVTAKIISKLSIRKIHEI